MKRHSLFGVVPWAAIPLLLTLGPFTASAQPIRADSIGGVVSACGDFDQRAQRRITEYLSQKFALPIARITFKGSEPANSRCYRKISFFFEDLRQDATFYLSPDGQFLSTTLFDTYLDPIAERKAKADETLAALMADTSPIRGQVTAPVKIVEFGDFECPFCRQFTEIMEKEYSGVNKDKVVLVYKHFPLAKHPWSELAAEGSMCAWLQQPAAFWQLHDFLFANQASLTSSNIEQEMLRFLGENSSLEVEKFQRCLKNGTTADLIRRDGELAAKFGVTGTPTLFVNGLKIGQLASGAAFDAVIQKVLSGELLAGPAQANVAPTKVNK